MAGYNPPAPPRLADSKYWPTLPEERQRMFLSHAQRMAEWVGAKEAYDKDYAAGQQATSRQKSGPTRSR
jgi:hypothetical protein